LHCRCVTPPHRLELDGDTLPHLRREAAFRKVSTQFLGEGMSGQPLWYTQVQFTHARPVPIVRVARDIPDKPGCYVFTSNSGKLVPGQVIYVGKALSLRARVQGYLVDYMKTKPTNHKGRAFIFEYRHDHGEANLFLRWTIYGDPSQLEASLIDHLRPQCNDRDESDPFSDDEPLDPRYLP
jgi:hypothetical protein